MVNAWVRPPDTADIDRRIAALQARQPARILLTSTGNALLAERRRSLDDLPSVDQAVARSQARALKAELVRDELAQIVASVYGSEPSPAQRAQLAEIRREVYGDDRPRMVDQAGTTTAQVRKIRKAASPIRAAQKPKRPLSVAEQRALVASMRGAGDLTRRWDGPRRIGTLGYHNRKR